MTTPLPPLLAPAQVLLDLRANDAAEAIRAITGRLAGHLGVADPARLAAEVIERERLSSTALGCGVAFPHARTQLVREIVVAAGRSVAGVPFEAAEPVHFVFVIGTPPDKVTQYLALVGRLARLLKNEHVREQLLAAPTAEAFVAALHPDA